MTNRQHLYISLALKKGKSENFNKGRALENKPNNYYLSFHAYNCILKLKPIISLLTLMVRFQYYYWVFMTIMRFQLEAGLINDLVQKLIL